MDTPAKKPFIAIDVEPHAALPDGVCLRYKAESPVRTVGSVRYQPDDGPLANLPDAIWQVVGVDAQAGECAAHAVQVEDSGAGTSWLIWGGNHGLRLRRDGQEVAETHLLLAEDQLAD